MSAMANVLNFYIDDSGTRRPNHDPGKRAKHGYDWFALGGVLVKQEDEPVARCLHREFIDDWEIDCPLHSVEIRGRNQGFLWLEDAPKEERTEFLEELYLLLKNAPVIGISCVIDRPGYNHRYFEKYGRVPWSLCKTAFTVAVERAAKYARSIGYKLRVAPARCNKPEDRLLLDYYKDLKETGMPFSTDSSDKYAPLRPSDFQEILHEFRLKEVTSPMAQFADMYLWPMCMGGYHASNKPYARLLSDGKLIECALAENDWPFLATKYSCFDLVQRKP
jgi:hypothetical protein